jgi:hypothetical protein
MNWRFDRLRALPLDAVLIAVVLLAISQIFWSHIGINVSDGGQLWYGTIQTALGEVPVRDFQSYDPGRYYWGALWFKILGDDGIKSLGFSALVFQFIGMVLGLLVLRRRILKTWWALAAAGLVIWIWLGGHESVIIISAIYFAVLLVEKPSNLRHFSAGAFVGIVAFFGRNHGLYCAVAFSALILFIWLRIDRRKLPVRLCLWLLGVIVGYLPMLVMIALIPGFLHAVIEGIKFNLYVARRLPLPVPWPWRPDYSRLGWGASAFVFGVGILYLLVPVSYVVGVVHLLTTKRDLQRKTVLIACVFVGLAFLDYAFSRASFDYLAMTIWPALIGLMAIPAAFDQRYKRVLTIGAWAFILIASRATIWEGAWSARSSLIKVPVKALVRYHGNLDIAYREYGFVRTEIRGDDLWIDTATAKTINDVKELVGQKLAPDENILIAPYWPGFYPILRKKSPVWENYFLLPQPKERQEEMIDDLERKNVNWVIVQNPPLDGRDELRFSNTHAYMWQYLMEKFERVDTDLLPPDLQLRHRTKKIEEK